jgi:hypothetical protein
MTTSGIGIVVHQWAKSKAEAVKDKISSLLNSFSSPIDKHDVSAQLKQVEDEANQATRDRNFSIGLLFINALNIVGGGISVAAGLGGVVITNAARIAATVAHMTAGVGSFINNLASNIPSLRNAIEFSQNVIEHQQKIGQPFSGPRVAWEYVKNCGLLVLMPLVGLLSLSAGALNVGQIFTAASLPTFAVSIAAFSFSCVVAAASYISFGIAKFLIPSIGASTTPACPPLTPDCVNDLKPLLNSRIDVIAIQPPTMPMPPPPPPSLPEGPGGTGQFICIDPAASTPQPPSPPPPPPPPPGGFRPC